MDDRPLRPSRAEVAALLGMATTTLEPVVSSEPAVPSEPVPRAPGFEPGDRLAVLVILVTDDERTLRRLRPIVHRVYGLTHDLTEREALAVAEGLRP